MTKHLQRCINRACSPYELDSGATARYWASGDEAVGSTNTGVAQGLTTIVGDAADFTIADTAALGTSVRPTQPGLYLATLNIGDIGAAENGQLGITLDGAVLTSSFAATDAGMRAYSASNESSGPACVVCMIPINATTLANSTLGFIRFMIDPAMGVEFSLWAQIQRIGSMT